MVIAGYVAATGPTMDKNAVDILKLKARKPRRSSKPATAINKKIRFIGVEIFVFVLFVQENRIVIAIILTNSRAMIGPKVIERVLEECR